MPPPTTRRTAASTRKKPTENPPLKAEPVPTTPDDLADEFANVVTINASGRDGKKKPPSAGTSQRRVAAAAKVRTRTLEKSSSKAETASANLTDLANHSVAVVALKDPSTGKGKKTAAPLSVSERQIAAMRSVNAALQTLSGLVATGWNAKASSDTKAIGKKKDITLDTVNASGDIIIQALRELRQSKPNDVDLERAASSLLTKLIALQMFDLSMIALKDTHTALLSICSPANKPLTPTSEPLNLLSLPLSLPPSQLGDQMTLTIISTYLLNSLTIIANISPSPELASLSRTLMETPTLLDWAPHLCALPSMQKHTDAVLTRAYSVLTKSATLVTTSTQTSRELYAVRAYALRLLLHTSQGTIDPNTFWDQAMKFATVLVKGSNTAEIVATKVVLTTFDELVERSKAVDPERWRQGTSWIDFCDFWMGFATKAGDVATLDCIGRLIASSVPASRSGPASDQEAENQQNNDTARITLEYAKYCATFARTTVALESLTKEKGGDGCVRSDVVGRARECIALLKGDFPRSQDVGNEPLDGAREKMSKALERLRRANLKLLEVLGLAGDTDAETRCCLVKLAEEIVQILAREQEKRGESDNTRPILDTLFVLARSTLDPADAQTYEPAYNYLLRCSHLIGPGSVSATVSASGANRIRCVSGAFYHLAGTLYQSGRYGGAVRFLKEGCLLGVKALNAIREARKGKGKGAGKAEAIENAEEWKSLEEQLYRRWELLAVSYSKIGERRMAFQAYLECVKTFPYSSTSFSSTLDFRASPAMKQLGNLVDKLTYLATCDLLLEPDQVSLRTHLSSADLGHGILGQLVERQLDCLDPYLWKRDVTEVVIRLLGHALELYQDSLALRRARVLLRCLELTYNVGPETVLIYGWEPEEMGREVGRILERNTFTLDDPTGQTVLYYQASAQLWLALHAHRRADPQQRTLVAGYADQGCRILRTPLAPSPSAPGLHAADLTKRKAPASRRVGTKAKAPVPQPVTPKSRKATSSDDLDASSQVDSATKPQAGFNGFARLLLLLHMSSRLLGLLGLFLGKVHVLETTRRLCERHTGVAEDDYISASTDLAHEYVRLGKVKKAAAIYNHTLDVLKTRNASDETQAKLFLRFAQSLAVSNDCLQSSSMYCEALQLSESGVAEEKTMSTSERIRARASRLERAAIASHVFAVIQYWRGNTVASLDSMQQALRLWNRAADTISRLAAPPQPPKPAAEPSNPFEVPSAKDAPTAATSDPPNVALAFSKKSFGRGPQNDGVEWRIAEGLLETLFWLVDIYFARGSAREASYFAQSAQDLAESLGAPAMVSRALARKGEIELSRKQLQEAHDSLADATDLVQSLSGTDTADLLRLQGEYHSRSEQPQDAQQLYERSVAIVEELDKTLSAVEVLPNSPKKAEHSQTSKEVLLPALLASVLHQHIWLLRDNPRESAALLQRLRMLSSSLHTKIEENALMARLSLHDVYSRLRADVCLGSVIESTIALPMGMSNGRKISLSSSTQEILAILDTAEHLFWNDLNAISRRGKASQVRAAAVSLTLIRALQTSLGKAGKQDAALVASLLNASSAITLHREMLDTIQSKFFDPETCDDIQWPLMSADGHPLPRSRSRGTRARPRFVGRAFADSDGEDGEPDESEASLKRYWENVRTRYSADSFVHSKLTSPKTDPRLPAHWTVVNIGVTEDGSTLFVTRQHAGREPLMFCVPLKERRESSDDAESRLTFHDAISELHDIIKSSDEGTRQAVNVRNDDNDAKAAWWAARRDLDRRLKELLDNIEFCWLGGFKTILSPRILTPPEMLADLRTTLENIFQRALRHQKRKAPAGIRLDDALIECFSRLPPDCGDEELEDLVYFILDLYQFHGVAVAIAEVDVGLVTVELQMALESHAAKVMAQHIGEEADSHMFLVLDKNVQGIPWESIPILRGRSVSRIPSMEFLLDRLQLASWEKDPVTKMNVDRASVDPRKVYYVLNPSNDLRGTEERYRAWLKEMRRSGWDGVVGKPPSEQQLLDALSKKDLVIYFGHGGAEQYVRSHRLRNLPRCATVMLWGCSSGVLREMGDFDRVGTPYNYMLAGCPTLVANIWDVTDRDIDKFAQSVFDKLDLTTAGVTQPRTAEESMSIVAAVSQSRDICKLKYLTGAAPVVYGIPFYL